MIQTLSKKLWLPKTALSRALAVGHFTKDEAFTFDHMGSAPVNQMGDARGIRLPHAYSYVTADGQNITVDSTGAFLVGELEKLDQTLHMPLVSVSWSRDIDLREDVALGDDVSSYTLSTFASPGSLGTGHGIRNGKAWIGKATTQIGGVSVDIGKITNPLTPWGLEVKYTVMELAAAAQAGRPIDAQKYEGLKLKHQMDIDEQIYVGDASLSQGGLFNNALVTNVSNLPNGAVGASPNWSTKTPAEILADVNALITSTWRASAWAVMPSRILIPPTQYGYISTQTISSAGTTSILKYLLENNVLVATGKGKLEILPAKWLEGAGSGGTIGNPATANRMVCYTKAKQYVRFPMTPLQRTPVQYDSIYQKSTYYCKLGVVELVYPETMAYRDGL